MNLNKKCSIKAWVPDLGVAWFTKGVTSETHSPLFGFIKLFYKLILDIAKMDFVCQYLLLGVTFKQAFTTLA